MKELSNFNADDLGYLKIRWTGDIEDLRTQVAKDTKRLDRRIASTENDTDELSELELQLEQAQTDLQEMIDAGLSSGIIDRKTAEVAELEQEVEEERLAPTGITPREAQQQLRAIAAVEMEIGYLEAKIVEIDSILANAA
ncbi:MAG: hypothetical protein MK081_15520 [Flavobacteriales bacterium]|uniref:hypothetical protein n=1 Tax=Sanyastnella coralliicola TaxID=3069118 RepID=UPI0027BA32A8|nr:hypothetical protein [Longitalea sp. SCSIO 12813]MCH2200182.1 hypothetical protein [Flavobacteriales bacterium]